jgi:hypothetical protein
VNAWSVLLLLADVAAIVFGVVVTFRGRSAGDDPVVVRLQLAEVAMTGTLIALVALASARMGLVEVSALVGASVGAGRGLRLAMGFSQLRDRGDSGVEPYFWGSTAGTVVMAVIVVAGVLRAWSGGGHVPTAAERDSADLGIKVFDHADGVPFRVLDRRPVLADSGTTYGVAVPVVRYRVDGDELRLVVAHDLTCAPATVLLAPDRGALDVVVVYRPSGLTGKGSPDAASSAAGPESAPAPTDTFGTLPAPNARTCQPEPPAVWVVNTVIQVPLPPAVAPSPAPFGAGAPPARPVPALAVHDVGAGGSASPVTSPTR